MRSLNAAIAGSQVSGEKCRGLKRRLVTSILYNFKEHHDGAELFG